MTSITLTDEMCQHKRGFPCGSTSRLHRRRDRASAPERAQRLAIARSVAIEVRPWVPLAVPETFQEA